MTLNACLAIIEAMNEKTSFNELSCTWVENIALEEINMEESGIVVMNDHLNPAIYLEESSIKFLDQIRDLFEFYLTRFNEFRGGITSGSHIKLFKISNTVNDFMLFRNSLRLIFARKANDVISIGLLINSKDVLAPRLPGEDENSFSHGSAHEIRAHIGAFNKISWRFQGEEVDVDAMVRHYLTEFIRQSAR